MIGGRKSNTHISWHSSIPGKRPGSLSVTWCTTSKARVSASA